MARNRTGLRTRVSRPKPSLKLAEGEEYARRRLANSPLNFLLHSPPSSSVNSNLNTTCENEDKKVEESSCPS